MWWSRLLLCLTVLVLGPVGCGFEPIYARNGTAPASGSVADEMAAIRVDGINDRIGQQLRNNLVLSLSPRGEPAAPRYVLIVTLNETLAGLANSRDGKATVGRNTITANYVLSDSRGGATLLSGQARAIGSYRFLGPRYASTASERDAQTSVLGEVSEMIRTEIAAYFANPATFASRRRDTVRIGEPENPASTINEVQ